MAVSDGVPHQIPTAALAAFDHPPTYFQHHSSEPTLYSLNNVSNTLNKHTNYLINNNATTPTNHFDLQTKTSALAAIISPEDEQQLPCEQYKEFLDASRDERVDMIDNLVDVSVDIIDSIWPSPHHAKVVGTKNFIREILKRSKTTYFMLQLSLFYIFRVKRVVQTKLRLATTERRYRDDLMCCGRRMFLASLMVASKYIHDKSYRNKAWAEASGLTCAEINASELAFLQMIDYRLYVSKPTFEKWYDMLNQRLKQRKQHLSLSSTTTATTTTTTTRLLAPNPIKKPNVKPTATATTAGKAMMTNIAHSNKVPVTVSLNGSAAHYPSPASPCFYHPDLNVRT